MVNEECVPDTVNDAAAAAEYWARFCDKPMHDAVLDVVCRAAALMGRLCDDNGVRSGGRMQAMAKSLGEEAYVFVTQYMRVRFGESHTTKMHALAYHLADELSRRGNLVEADTSVNEMLQKNLKAFFFNTSRHPTSFQVQIMRCEMTLFKIVSQDLKDISAEEKKGDEGLQRWTACASGSDRSDCSSREQGQRTCDGLPDDPTCDDGFSG